MTETDNQEVELISMESLKANNVVLEILEHLVNIRGKIKLPDLTQNGVPVNVDIFDFILEDYIKMFLGNHFYIFSRRYSGDPVTEAEQEK